MCVCVCVCVYILALISFSLSSSALLLFVAPPLSRSAENYIYVIKVEEKNCV